MIVHMRRNGISVIAENIAEQVYLEQFTKKKLRILFEGNRFEEDQISSMEISKDEEED